MVDFGYFPLVYSFFNILNRPGIGPEGKMQQDRFRAVLEWAERMIGSTRQPQGCRGKGTGMGFVGSKY